MFDMKYEVTYLGELRTELKHLDSGELVRTDAPVDNQGQGRFFSPTDLTATALASCMITIIGITAQKRGMQIASMKAECDKKMKSDPRRIGVIRVRLTLEIPEITQDDRETIEAAAKNCPVALSLHPDIKQDVNFLWH